MDEYRLWRFPRLPASNWASCCSLTQPASATTIIICKGIFIMPKPAQSERSQRASNCVTRGSSCFQVEKTCSEPGSSSFTRSSSPAEGSSSCQSRERHCPNPPSSCRALAEVCSETSYASCDMKLLGNIFSTASILILVFSHILTPLLCNFV